MSPGGMTPGRRSRRRLMRPRATRIETVSVLRLSALAALLQRRGLLANERIPAHGGRRRPGHRRRPLRLATRRPGDVFVARRGQHADGHDHVRGRRGRGRRRGHRRAARAGPRACRSSSCATPRLPWRWQRRGGSGDPSQRLGIVGITGHGRQDDDGVPRARHPGGGRAPHRLRGHHRRHRRRPQPRQRGPHQHAGGPRAAGAPGRAWRPPATPGRSWSRPRTAWPSSASAASPTTSPCSPTSPPSTSSSTARWRRTGTPSRASSRGWPQRREPREGLGQARHHQRRRPAVRGRRGHRQRRGRPACCAMASRVAGRRPRHRRATARTSWPPAHRGRHRWHARRRAGAGLVGIARPAPGGPLQRPQRPRGHGRGVSPRAGPGCRGRRPGAGRERPGPHAAHRRGSAVQRHRRLRAHRRGARARCSTSWRRPTRRAGCIAVFGSAGERDVAKRAEMGRVAGERCRLVVVTDEVPARRGPHGHPGGHRRRRRGGRQAAWPGPAASSRPCRGHRRGPAPGAPRRCRAAGRQGPREDHRDRRTARSPGTRPRWRPRRPLRDLSG